jgi:hypothetical protein
LIRSPKEDYRSQGGSLLMRAVAHFLMRAGGLVKLESVVCITPYFRSTECGWQVWSIFIAFTGSVNKFLMIPNKYGRTCCFDFGFYAQIHSNRRMANETVVRERQRVLFRLQILFD